MRKNRISPITTILLIAASVLFLMSCGKFPDDIKTNQPDDNLVWSQNGKSLKSLSSLGDTMLTYAGVPAPYWVHDSITNAPISNVSFNFGDGTPLETGREILHTYANPGLYIVTAYIGNVTLQRYNRVHVYSTPGGNNATILLLSGSYNGNTGLNTLHLALNLERIATWQTPPAGLYFTAGPYNEWAYNQLNNADTMRINGHKYISWFIDWPNGDSLEFGYGKTFTSSLIGATWAYDPSSPYWHVNPYTPGQVYFKLYVYNGLIYSVMPGQAPLPGDYGDQGGTWKIRGINIYNNQQQKADVKLLIRKSAIPNANAPFIHYKIDEGAYTNGTLIDAGEYYWYVIPAVNYQSIISFDVYPYTGAAKINFSGSSFFNDSHDTCLLQVLGGVKKCPTGNLVTTTNIQQFIDVRNN